ncbi:unnamed protein product [Linum tenue]|uniref:Uncharacterized protein n=1 Tax=Linum tenue TaxID=586396 RepID=A0AAV0HD68_9ROSI|nr:unnamed protein product [Linum tenue]
MICFTGKKKKKGGSEGMEGERVRLLEEELEAIMYEREKESKAYERDVMVFAFKEAEWKQEKKKLKEEVKRLKKAVEEKEEIIKGFCDQNYIMLEEDYSNYWQQLSAGTATNFLLQQMREERALRDEAVDRWKKLYLAIKTELDDLIQKTHPGDGLMYCRAVEEEESATVEELRMDVKLKEETIADLKARLIVSEREEFNRAREVDILRQSLRIVGSSSSSSNKKSSSLRLGSKPNFSFVKRVVKVVVN